MREYIPISGGICEKHGKYHHYCRGCLDKQLTKRANKEIKKELEKIYETGTKKEALGQQTNMLAVEILSAIKHLIERIK